MAFFIVARKDPATVELVTSECFETRDSAMSHLASLSSAPAFPHWECEVFVADLSGAAPVLLVRSASPEPEVASPVTEPELDAVEEPFTQADTEPYSDAPTADAAAEWSVSEPDELDATAVAVGPDVIAELPDSEPLAWEQSPEPEATVVEEAEDAKVTWPWESDTPSGALSGGDTESEATETSGASPELTDDGLTADAAAVLESLEADFAKDAAELDAPLEIPDAEIDQLMDELIPDASEPKAFDASSYGLEPDATDSASIPEPALVDEEPAAVSPEPEAVAAPEIVEDPEPEAVTEPESLLESVPAVPVAAGVVEPMGVGASDISPESPAEEIADFIFDLGNVTTIPELAAEDAPPAELDQAARDLAAATCEECVYDSTCPNKGQRTPEACGSFQWKIG